MNESIANKIESQCEQPCYEELYEADRPYPDPDYMDSKRLSGHLDDVHDNVANATLGYYWNFQSVYLQPLIDRIHSL